jgi:hypothetical protein
MRAFIIICDRCGREERKKDPSGSGHMHLQPPDWASVWPGCVTPLGWCVEYESEQHVCPRCLREDERERLVERQERDALQEQDVFPF